MDRNPATSASAVPPTPSPPTSPATTPSAKNSAAISLKPQPSRRTPNTSAANAMSTRVRTAPRRASSVLAPGSGSMAGTVRVRAAYRTVPHVQMPGVAEASHQPLHGLPQRPGLVDHGERPADQEHEEDHRGRVGQAAGDGDERLERPHGPRHHGVIGARDHDPAAGGGVVPAVVLAR